MVEILVNVDALSKNYGEIPCVTEFKRLRALPSLGHFM